MFPLLIECLPTDFLIFSTVQNEAANTSCTVQRCKNTIWIQCSHSVTHLFDLAMMTHMDQYFQITHFVSCQTHLYNIFLSWTEKLTAVTGKEYLADTHIFGLCLVRVCASIDWCVFVSLINLVVTKFLNSISSIFPWLKSELVDCWFKSLFFFISLKHYHNWLHNIGVYHIFVLKWLEI